MPARFSGIRSPTARSLCSTVSWTALQNGKTLAMTSVGGASVASWTRIGHAPALIDRVRACVLDTPPTGVRPFQHVIYTTSDIFAKIYDCPLSAKN